MCVFLHVCASRQLACPSVAAWPAFSVACLGPGQLPTFPRPCSHTPFPSRHFSQDLQPHAIPRAIHFSQAPVGASPPTPQHTTPNPTTHASHLSRAAVPTLHQRVGPAAAPQLAGCQQRLVLQLLHSTKVREGREGGAGYVRLRGRHSM